jgi:2-polyprenyl-6-hydroxyphenyl methylase / 3-demethylubiquinone-9 3-methyltransferase
MNVVNVDFEEVKKFDEMARYWWDLKGPCRPLHLLNPVRLAFIQTCCALPQKNVIDVGCGGGILTETLSTFSKRVVGIDQSTQALAVATQHSTALTPPPEYHCMTVEEYAIKEPGAFDVLTCLELLEHVPDPLGAIKACAALVHPGGDLFFSTLNRTPKAFLLAIVGAEYVLNMLPKGTHRYDRFIRPSELAHWASLSGLEVKHIKGLRYNPFRKAFDLSSDASVNYLIHCQKA